MSDRIYVAVGVIYSLDKKQVLISKRKAEQHLAGLWEFPGGKVEYKESVQSALKRELHEELGIEVISTSQLTTISYDYPDKKVLLDVWLVKEWSGKPESKENQQLAWVQIDNLTSYSFPEANKHIIQTLTLPSIYLVSPSSYENLTEFISTAEQCFIAGIKVFQLRLELIEEAEYLKLINKLSNLAKIYSVKLILNGKPRDIEKYSINGIHLKSKELFNYESRPVSEELLLGASCHNEKELLQAKKLNVNYAFISPIKKTLSHPESVPLGWKKFKELRKEISFPVYALGGLNIKDLETAKSNSAYGIAMISAIWNNPETMNSN